MRASALLATAAACAVGLILFVVWQLESSPSSPADARVPAPDAELAAREAAPRTVELADPAESRSDVELALAPAAPETALLEVLVTNAAGQPIADAEVRSEIDEYAEVRRTDARGWARIALPPASPGARLHVDAEGYHHADEWGPVSKRAEITLSRLASIEGSVLARDTSTGIAGAEVWLSDLECGLCQAPRAVTDGAGGFELSDLPLGVRSRVRASAVGFVAGERSFVLREDGSQLELWLDPGLELWMEVVDFETGTAVEGAWIARGGQGGARIEVPPTGRLRTSELVGHQDEERAVRLTAGAEGYCTLFFQVDPRTIRPGELTTLRTPRVASVEGVVHDPSGAPIAEAWVSAGENRRDGAKPEETGRASSPLDGVPKGWRFQGGAGKWAGTSTDHEGRFELASLVPWSRQYRLQVGAEDHEPVERLIELGPPSSSQSVEITLQPVLATEGGTVRGRLTLNGEGVGGSLRWTGPSASGSDRADDDGNFELTHVEPAMVRISPRPDGWSAECADLQGEWTVEVIEGQAAELGIALQLALGSISGRVLETGDEPARGVRVQAEADGGCIVHRAVTDDEGRFELEVDERFLAYTLSAREGPDPPRVEGVAPGSEDVVLRLTDLTTLRYRVVDRDTQRPIVDSRLLWRRPGEDRYRTRGFGRRGLPDPEGWHEVDLARGVYDLGISMARYDAAYLPTFIDGVHLGAEGGALLFEVERGLQLDLRSGGERPKKKGKRRNKRRWPKDVTVLLLDLEYLDDVRYKSGKDSWSFGPDLDGTNPLASWKVSFDKLGHARVRALRTGLHRFRSFPPGIRIHPAEIDVRPDMDPIEIQWSRADD